MDHAYETFKANPSDKKLQQQVIESVKKDAKAHTKAYLAEKAHKRLVKSGDKANAEKFWDISKKLYTRSQYFWGVDDGGESKKVGDANSEKKAETPEEKAKTPETVEETEQSAQEEKQQ